ncbi:MAG: hypothetical protein ABI691_08430 [Ginsengibacter sp.]
MHLPTFLKSISRKFLLITVGIVIALGIVFFIWQNNKYRIVNETIASKVAKETDSLYTISYDSLHFDEVLGTAYLKNIHVRPDTARIKNTDAADVPYILLDIKIASINVTGVKTDKALVGQKMIGDSVIIVDPEITVYFLKPIKKETNINIEAKSVYDEILGSLTLIKAGHVFINNVNVKGVGFLNKERQFDFINGNVHLRDVLIDSAHNLDTSRTLFCKEADVNVASFVTYNNDRPELRVSNIVFQGENNTLAFDDILVNRFDDDSSDSSKLLVAKGLTLDGLDADEFVKNKNIVIEKIACRQITLFEPPLQNLKSSPGETEKKVDTTGFRHVYSIDMSHLSFPEVNYVPAAKSDYKIGNISIKINNVTADEIYKVQKHPLDFSNEVELGCSSISMKSKDGVYSYLYRNIVLNSLRKQLDIASYNIKPLYNEKEFARREPFQKDRYDVAFKGIALKGIDMKNLLEKKIIASQLLINSTSAKIYRDLQRPLKDKSKVGNYPSQMLSKIDLPINVSRATLSHAYIEYKEREKLSDSTGVVKFTDGTLTIDNITNVTDAIQKNDAMKISFDAKALGTIPISGSFTFTLKDTSGKFIASGNIPSFDAHLLNDVAVPMALMRINTGTINSLDFTFKGNNYEAVGKMVMKYSDLKVDILKRDEESGGVKKKGLTSLLANIIVKNDNPRNGNLREESPHFDRDTRKSFFNLIWKTIFTGIKKTVGIP